MKLTFHDDQAKQLFRELRQGFDELVVPRAGWDKFFGSRSLPRDLELPELAVDHDWVVVERAYFVQHFAWLCGVRVERKRVPAGRNSYWVVTKLDWHGQPPTIAESDWVYTSGRS